MRKILLFAALGALGALLGAVICEPGFRRTLVWAKSYAPTGKAGTILAAPEPPPIAAPVQRKQLPSELPPPEPPPPIREFTKPATTETPPPPPEFAARLQRERAQSGDVQISLLWNSSADLDLECVDSQDELVFVTHPSRSGGKLDVDMNGTVPGIPTRKESEKPVENIFWPQGKAPPGRYRVYVTNCDPHGAPQPTRYEVNVLANGQRKSHAGSIRYAGQKRHPVMTAWGTGVARDLVCEFEVEAFQPSAPQLAITVPRRMEIAPGGTNRFQVRIARGFFEGDVRIELKDRPSEVEASTVLVPASSNEGTVEVRTTKATEPGERPLKVIAFADTKAGTVRAEGMVLLVVQPPAPIANPVVKLSIPERIELERGGATTFKVRVGRWYFPRPVMVTARLEGDGGQIAAGLSNDPIQLTPDVDVGVLEVRAAADARVGVETARVTALAESPFEANRVEQSIRIAIVDPVPQSGSVWPLTLVTGTWTAFVALGLSLALAVGQNRQLGRGWLGKKQASLLVPGAVLAGLVAGGLGQASSSWMAQAATAGHFAGWLLLGAMLGRGVAIFVPNLEGLRATAAGAAGGLLGAAALLAGTQGVGEVAGRGLGAATLGLAIGAMVALVEIVFRSAWLECRYGAQEVVSVNLGRAPVRIGSDSRVCTVYVSGAPALAAQYKLNDAGQVVFLDHSTERETMIAPGDERTFGAVTVTVRTAAASKMPATAPAAPKPPPPQSPPKPPAAALRVPLPPVGTQASVQTLRTNQPPPPPPPPRSSSTSPRSTGPVSTPGPSVPTPPSGRRLPPPPPPPPPPRPK